MAISKTSIQNMALILVGGKKVITDSDAIKGARLVKSLFEMSYKAMLVLPIDWKFATTRAQLTATTAPTIGSYSYRYKLPVKNLRIIAQIDVDDDDVEYQFRIENYVLSSRPTPVLVSNEATSYVKYIFDLGSDNDIGKWPPYFARLVALDLAILLCEPLKQDKKKKNQLLVMMTERSIGWLPQAIQANAIEDMDVSTRSVNLDKGNEDVLDAPTTSKVTKTYIVQRE